MNQRDGTMFPDDRVAEVFAGYPEVLRKRLLTLRSLILRTGRALLGEEGILETLKWGQAAYLPKAPKTGTTVRIDRHGEASYAVYVHCQTHLVDDFRSRYPKAFSYDGTRALVFAADEEPDPSHLEEFVGAAFTYHRSKRK